MTAKRELREVSRWISAYSPYDTKLMTSSLETFQATRGLVITYVSNCQALMGPLHMVTWSFRSERPSTQGRTNGPNRNARSSSSSPGGVLLVLCSRNVSVLYFHIHPQRCQTAGTGKQPRAPSMKPRSKVPPALSFLWVVGHIIVAKCDLGRMEVTNPVLRDA